MFIVKLHERCWLADWEGDPGRTIKYENAKKYKSELAAERALKKAREFRPFKDAEILKIEV